MLAEGHRQDAVDGIKYCNGILPGKERRPKTQRGYLDTSLIKMKIEQYTKTRNVKNRKQPYLV